MNGLTSGPTTHVECTRHNNDGSSTTRRRLIEDCSFVARCCDVAATLTASYEWTNDSDDSESWTLHMVPERGWQLVNINITIGSTRQLASSIVTLVNDPASTNNTDGARPRGAQAMPAAAQVSENTVALGMVPAHARVQAEISFVYLLASIPQGFRFHLPVHFYHGHTGDATLQVHCTMATSIAHVRGAPIAACNRDKTRIMTCPYRLAGQESKGKGSTVVPDDVYVAREGMEEQVFMPIDILMSHVRHLPQLWIEPGHDSTVAMISLCPDLSTINVDHNDHHQEFIFWVDSSMFATPRLRTTTTSPDGDGGGGGGGGELAVGGGGPLQSGGDSLGHGTRSMLRDALDIAVRSLPVGVSFNAHLPGLGMVFPGSSRVFNNDSLTTFTTVLHNWSVRDDDDDTAQAAADAAGNDPSSMDIQAVLNDPTATSDRIVILVTNPNVGSQALHVGASTSSNAPRLFVIVGEDVQPCQLSSLSDAAQSRQGLLTHMSSDIQAESCLTHVLQVMIHKILQPCLHDITVDWGYDNSNIQQLPQHPAPVMQGERLVIFAVGLEQYQKDHVTLRARIGSQEYVHHFSVPNHRQPGPHGQQGTGSSSGNGSTRTASPARQMSPLPALTPTGTAPSSSLPGGGGGGGLNSQHRGHHHHHRVLHHLAGRAYIDSLLGGFRPGTHDHNCQLGHSERTVQEIQDAGKRFGLPVPSFGVTLALTPVISPDIITMEDIDNDSGVADCEGQHQRSTSHTPSTSHAPVAADHYGDGQTVSYLTSSDQPVPPPAHASSRQQRPDHASYQQWGDILLPMSLTQSKSYANAYLDLASMRALKKQINSYFCTVSSVPGGSGNHHHHRHTINPPAVVGMASTPFAVTASKSGTRKARGGQTLKRRFRMALSRMKLAFNHNSSSPKSRKASSTVVNDVHSAGTKLGDDKVACSSETGTTSESTSMMMMMMNEPGANGAHGTSRTHANAHAQNINADIDVHAPSTGTDDGCDQESTANRPGLTRAEMMAWQAYREIADIDADDNPSTTTTTDYSVIDASDTGTDYSFVPYGEDEQESDVLTVPGANDGAESVVHTAFKRMYSDISPHSCDHHHHDSGHIAQIPESGGSKVISGTGAKSTTTSTTSSQDHPCHQQNQYVALPPPTTARSVITVTTTASKRSIGSERFVFLRDPMAIVRMQNCEGCWSADLNALSFELFPDHQLDLFYNPPRIFHAGASNDCRLRVWATALAACALYRGLDKFVGGELILFKSYRWLSQMWPGIGWSAEYTLADLLREAAKALDSTDHQQHRSHLSSSQPEPKPQQISLQARSTNLTTL